MILNTQKSKNTPTVSGYIRSKKQTVFYTNGSEYKEDSGENTIKVALNSILAIDAVGDYVVDGGLVVLNYGGSGISTFNVYRVTGDFRIG